jgi:gliding motility-associated-like protein
MPVFTSRVEPYDFNMKIFNRWGELIFETYDLTSGWDGTFNDIIVQDGTYVWSINFGDTDSDKKMAYKGHVNILK